MRNPAVGVAMRALCHGALAVTLGGLLQACGTSTGEDLGGAGGGGAAGTGDGSGAGDGSVAVAGGGGDAGDGGVAVAGDGGGAGTGSAAGAGAGTGGTGEVVVDVVCNAIAAGSSTVVVNGVTRTFSVQMPSDTSEMALLFVWHGFMQNPTTFSNEVVYDVPAGKWVPFDPNAFPMPLLIVTPTSTNLLPLGANAGLDWDISSGATDFPFFEGMLQCLQDQLTIDETRIYSFGFSAGAVFTNLLSAKYPHLFAATISESGAWFNDMAQWSDVSIPAIQWKWPAFDAADGGNVLLTHGGPNDFATVISLESANKKALPFLHDNGRTVIDCAHDFGHTLAPDLTQAMYYEYMWSHQLGGEPLSGLVPSFPTPANPVGSTSCTFHPAP